MKKITFKIPTENGTRDAEGYKVQLQIGGEPEWFMLQDSGGTYQLAHYVTGFMWPGLPALHLARFVRSGYLNDSLGAWRRTAQQLIDLTPADKAHKVIEQATQRVGALNPL